MRFGTTIGGFYDRIDGFAQWREDQDEPPSMELLELTVGGTATRLDELPTEDIDRRLNDLGVDRTVHLPTTHPLAVRVPEVRTGIVEYLDRALCVAAAFGATKAVAHAATPPHDPADESVLRETVTELVDRGRDHSVKICIENVGHLDRGFDLDTVGRAVVDTDAALCLDTGHAYLEVGNDGIREFLASYADRVSHVHLHDARDRGDSHVPLGAGEVDPTAATALAGYNPTVVTEVFTDDWALLWDSARRFREAVH